MRELYQSVLGILNLKRIHISFLFDGSGIEQEDMRRDREQRFGQFANVLHEEVLDILTRQNNGGLLFADAFHEVSDVLDCREVGEKKVKFINTRDGISAAQKLLGHISENVEQQSVADILACLMLSVTRKLKHHSQKTKKIRKMA